MAEKKLDDNYTSGNAANIQAISNHIEKHIGEIHQVMHEIVSELVHIDVHWVRPSKKFPFHALVTSGISDRPMPVPAGWEDFGHIELCVFLPDDWKISPEAFKDENNYWPVRWLKIIGSLPFRNNTWIGYGHTIPNGEKAEPLAPEVKFGGFILLPNLSVGQNFSVLNTGDGKKIRFYCLYPLYKEEINFKLLKGTEELISRMDELGALRDVVDIQRENACGKLDDDE